MRKLVAIVFAALIGAGGVGVALASTGPNGNNNHGLCTAYFNGSQQGMNNKHDHGPFPALEAAAQNEDGDTPEQQVWNWCMNPDNNPQKGQAPLIGGQPTDPNQ